LLHTLDLGNAEALRALLDQLLESFALKICARLDAERVTLFLANFEKGTLESKVALAEGGESTEITIPIASGIAGQVARTGETLNIADAYTHPAFNRSVDESTGFHTKSVLCMPIKDTGHRVFAVAQLLNKKGGGSFSEEDERRFNDFSNALGLIVESWARLRKR
jgi:adenylate cyclase